jgi:hypothetical protein
LIAARWGTEKGTAFIKEATKSSGAIALFEPIHGTVALCNSSMALLHMVVQVAVRPVRHLLPEHRADRPRIGIMPVGRNPVRRCSSHRPRGQKERLRRCEIPGLTKVHIHQVAVAVDCLVELLPYTPHLDIRFVHIPAVAHRTAASFVQGVAQQGC